MTSLPDALQNEPRAVIVFDGECNLCCFTVRFVAPRDPSGRFAFLAAQSPLGRAALIACGENPDDPDTFLLLERGAVYGLSDAALRIGRGLTRPWSWLAAAAGIVPRALRDPVYRLVARNRKRWFGARDVCFVPTPELKARFVGV